MSELTIINDGQVESHEVHFEEVVVKHYRATCTCGWRRTDYDLMALQSAAASHDLDCDSPEPLDSNAPGA